MPSSLLQAFGRRVRELRHERGLSQEGLADLAELHRTYIGGIERGERNVSLSNLQTLATALEVELGELLAGLKTPDGKPIAHKIKPARPR